MRMAVVLAMLLAANLLTRVLGAEAATKPTTAEPGPNGATWSLAGKFKGTDEGATAAKRVGGRGCLVIRSEARLEQVMELLKEVGWTGPGEGAAPPKVDFAKDVVVLVFNRGDEGSAFAVREATAKDGECDLQVVMSYIGYKQRERAIFSFNFVLVAVPRADRLKVSVSTYHPMNGGPHPTPDQAALEWTKSFDQAAGDVADGLTAAIEPSANRVKVGEDIQFQFKLAFADGTVPPGGMFARKTEAAFVWDGKYSNGYRNHGFLVQAPDGRVSMLRPREILEWDKNIPHPVSISAGHPYVLPNWREGEDFKSLKALGLDTSKAGKYVISGIYQEEGGRSANEGDQAAPMWGGNIASAPVTVEVVGD